MLRIIAITIIAALLVGCGGTYVNDKHNFERALGFQRPNDVEVIHSVYWKSPHFTSEYCYYLELVPGSNSNLLKTVTSPEHIARLTDEQREAPRRLAVERPTWFTPKARTSYEIWVSKKEHDDLVILRDKEDGRIFICDQQL